MARHYQYLKVNRDDLYGILSLNRPEKRNALNRPMREELLYFLKNEAERCKLLILTGTGTAFCAGMDLREQNFREGAAHFLKVVRTIYECNCIFIAAINGAARGGGLMIINACDVAIANETSSFGMPDISSGENPVFADSVNQNTVRKNAGKYLTLAGKSIGPSEAKKFGLLNQVVPAGQLLEKAEDLARQLLEVGISELIKRKKELNKKPFDNAIREKEAGLINKIRF